MLYKKKQVVVSAVQFLSIDYLEEISKFLGAPIKVKNGEPIILIDTLEGTHEAREGDWIIKGIKGEFYPCKPDIFASTYEALSFFDFGAAIQNLKIGKKVSRRGWNGKGLWLELEIPNEASKMTLPYIYMCYPSSPASETAPENHISAKVPWLASQTDMLAEDWVLVP